MYNEEKIIATTLTRLLRKKLHERFRILVCDDGSQDHSVDEAKIFADNFENIDVIRNEDNRNKVGVIKSGLNYISTPYVLIIDADSIIHEFKKNAIDSLIVKAEKNNFSAIGFRIVPGAKSTIEKLQKIDYLFFTDSIRKLLGVIVCLIGQGVIWKTERLKNILEKHSGIFEGDDLENTILLSMEDPYGKEIYFEKYDVIIETILKKSIRSLHEQRYRIWDFGLIHVFFDIKGMLKQKGSYGAFFKGILITEIGAHPFKLLAIISVIIITVIQPILLYADANGPYYFLERIAISAFLLLISLNVMYVILGVLIVLNSIYCEWRRPKHALKWALYFFFYLITPVLCFFVTPSMIYLVETDLIEVFYSVLYWWWPSLILTYVWWYSWCVILIYISNENLRTKSNMLIYGLLMPIYYMGLLITRTLGFLRYIIIRILGVKPSRHYKA